jgi:hypothetical protein
VDPADHNTNQLDLSLHPLELGAEQVEREWTDGRRDHNGSQRRSEILKSRHLSQDFHLSALSALAKGRVSRQWTNAEILKVIRMFTRQHGQPPRQSDFRSSNGLPSYSTVWRRFGSIHGCTPNETTDTSFVQTVDPVVDTLPPTGAAST